MDDIDNKKYIKELPKFDRYGFIKKLNNENLDDNNSNNNNNNKNNNNINNDDESLKFKHLEKEWIKLKKERRLDSIKSKELLKKGIPSSIRGFMWKELCKIKNVKNKTCSYYELLTSLSSSQKVMYEAEIKKDISRTFNDHVIFSDGSNGQQSLYNICSVYSIYNDKVGYKPGVIFIPSLLLIFMDEEDAFWCLVQISERLQMSEIWNLLYLQNCNDILDTLLKKLFPSLFQHFKKLDLPTAIYSAPYFICLFIINLPFEYTIRIWDLFLSDGLVIIFGSCCALFNIYKNRLLKSNYEQILILLKFSRNINNFQLKIDVSPFIKLVLEYKSEIESKIKDGLILYPK